MRGPVSWKGIAPLPLLCDSDRKCKEYTTTTQSPQKGGLAFQSSLFLLRKALFWLYLPFFIFLPEQKMSWKGKLASNHSS